MAISLNTGQKTTRTNDFYKFTNEQNMDNECKKKKFFLRIFNNRKPKVFTKQESFSNNIKNEHNISNHSKTTTTTTFITRTNTFTGF